MELRRIPRYFRSYSNIKFLMMKIIKSLFLISFLILTFLVQAQDSTHTNTTTSFKVFGACDQCKNRIENALKIKGIKKAVWDVDAQLLDLVYDSTFISLNKIENKIIAESLIPYHHCCMI